MDCDTTGIEPDFALVKFKKLAGGGYFKIINTSVPPALHALGYSDSQIKEIIQYALGKGTFEGAPGISRQSLIDKGIPNDSIDRIEKSLQNAISLDSCFSPSIVGYDVLEKLEISKEEVNAPGFSLLSRLGYDEKQKKKLRSLRVEQWVWKAPLILNQNTYLSSTRQRPLERKAAAAYRGKRI